MNEAEANIANAGNNELVAFARAMALAVVWSAEQAIDFFAWSQKWEREFAAWTLLGRPADDGDPGWDEFLDLANGSEGRLREYLWEAQG